MASPVNDSYSVANGVTMYVGRAAPVNAGYPSWRPAPGFFADISLNTLADIAPSGWPVTDIASPFSNWSGNNYNDDLGPLGGTSNHGSGHLALSSNPLWAGVNNFNASTQLFTMSNVPPVPVSDDTTNYQYWEVPAGQPGAGFTMVPHTYGGTLIRSAAAGGGPKGSMVRVNFPGAGVKQATHEFDLSLPSGAPARVISETAIAGGYPCACVDEAGTGFYLLDYYGQGPMRHYTFGTVQGQPYNYTLVPGGASFNSYGNAQMVLKPGANSCLVSTAGAPASGSVELRICPIIAGVPQSWTTMNVTGTSPNDSRCGLKWSTILQCFVTINGGTLAGGGTGNATVHRLTPPASGSLITGTWTWTSEVVVGLGGAILSRSRVADNGTWGNLVELPKCGTLVFCNSIFDKMQALTLQGM
jgi:hypothetical protein